MSDISTIHLKAIYQARKPVYRFLQPTALRYYSELSDLTGIDLWAKHENHQPTGSFKIRGGVNVMHHLQQNGVKGVVTFSTGNHGLSVATSAKWLGLEAVVVVPEACNPAKQRKILATGAELIQAGKTFEACAQKVEELAHSRQLYAVHPANEPQLINGVATEFLEILEQQPDLDAMIIPIGAGSELAAAVTVFQAIRPEIKIYAVQAAASPAAYQSWKKGQIVTADNQTFAGGFATGSGYDMPFQIYHKHLTDFVLLSESEIYRGIALAAHYTQNLLEGSGAASLMAAIKLKDQLKGQKVVIQFSGCNASPEEIHKAYKLTEFSSGWQP